MSPPRGSPGRAAVAARLRAASARHRHTSCRPAAGPALVVAPAGFRLQIPAQAATGPVLLGRTVLYNWAGDGWVRETVVRRSRTLGFPHVVRYGPRSALGAAMIYSLLDAPRTGPLGPVVPDEPAGPLL